MRREPTTYSWDLNGGGRGDILFLSHLAMEFGQIITVFVGFADFGR